MTDSQIGDQFRDVRPAGGYQFIMADPPWSFRNFSPKGWGKGAQRHYACQGLDWIKGLPVADLADRAGCLLWLWATNPMLDQQIETLRAWGFTFKTAGAWRKITANGKVHFGTGYVLRSAHEPFLIGTIGRPRTTRAVRSIFDGRVREHSRKPVEGYEQAEKLMPDARRVELFARERRAGWDAWGDQVEFFDGKSGGVGQVPQPTDGAGTGSGDHGPGGIRGVSDGAALFAAPDHGSGAVGPSAPAEGHAAGEG